MIIKLARKGLTPSQIGVQLRDSQGIPQVRFLTGNKILRILKSHGEYLRASASIAFHSAGWGSSWTVFQSCCPLDPASVGHGRGAAGP